jgi:hypothetical protein
MPSRRGQCPIFVLVDQKFNVEKENRKITPVYLAQICILTEIGVVFYYCSYTAKGVSGKKRDDNPTCKPQTPVAVLLLLPTRTQIQT